VSTTTTGPTWADVESFLTKRGLPTGPPVRDGDGAAEPTSFSLTPLDWPALMAGGLPETRYLSRPYCPEGARIWAWGPAESGKSLWALWLAASLSREGLPVAYVSQENPLAEDARRLERLRPDWPRLRFFHDQGLDLIQADHVAEFHRATEDATLIVLDTLTACWSGDENDNAALAAFDRGVLLPMARRGASVLTLDHTGHPQAFVRRRGVSAGRGGSVKGQKADVVLEFRATGSAEFTIDHAKNRMGGHKEPPRSFRVVDTDDDGLDVVAVERAADRAVAELADRMVTAIESAGVLSTKALRQAVGGGRELADDAIRLLEGEDPPRVRVGWEALDTDHGRQRAKAWRPAGGLWS